MLDAYLGALLALLTIAALAVILGRMLAPSGRSVAKAVPAPRKRKTNPERLVELRNIARHANEQTFWPCELVRDPKYGRVGRIDVVYADMQAAIDSFAIPPEWYELQEIPPKTPKNGIWYSVVLTDGAILAGQDDLELVDE